MPSIDKRTVQMEFDNQQFESGVHTTLSTLDKLKQSLSFKGGADGLKSISDEASRVNLNPIAQAADAVSSKFSVLGTVADQVLRRITDSALTTGKRLASAITVDPIIDGFHEYETQIGAIQTISANTGLEGDKGIAKINAALDDLNTYADKTIYNFTEMTRNIGTFTAAGIDLDRSKNAIKGIANLGAISGSTSAQVSNAMYQLSQALAAGKVNLMDWNSVVNAGMGGKVFQNALLRTGVMMGKINKSTADAIKNGKKSFRESISGKDSWLSSDILEETLNELSGVYTKADLLGKGYSESQADEILKLAQTGEKAATKVKTFSQLIDTLKEALGSGWTSSWRTIIGDFNEAQELWTGISDVLSNAINDSANARNAILNDWAELGGRTSILNGLKNVWEGFVKIIKPVKDAFTDIFPPTTGEQLANISKAFENFSQKLIISDETAENIKRTFKGLFSVFDIAKGVVESVVKAIFPSLESFGSVGAGILKVTANIGDYITKVDSVIKNHKIFERTTKALTKVFSPLGKAIELVGKAIGKFGDFLDDVKKKLKLLLVPIKLLLHTFKEDFKSIESPFKKLDGPLQTIKKNFEGVKESAKTLYHAIGAKINVAIHNLTMAIGSLSPVVNGVGSAFAFLTGGVATAVGWITKLTSGVSGLVSGGLSKVSTAIGGIGKSAGGEEKKASGIGTFFGNIGKTLKDTFSYLGSYIQGFVPKTSSLLEKIGGAITGLFSGIVELGKKAAPVVGKVFKSIGEGVSKAFKAIGQWLSKISIGDIVKTLISALTGLEGLGVLDNIRQILRKFAKDDKGNIVEQFMDSLKNSFAGDTVSNIVNGCKAIKESLVDTFSALQTNLKAKSLITIAAAIAIMAGSILLLSGVDPKALAASVAAIGGGVTEMVGAFKAIDQLKIDSSGMSKIAFSMVLMAAALFILSGAMKKLSSMSWEEVAKGLISVIGLMAAMTIVAKLLSSTTSLSSAHGIAGFFDNVGAGLKSMFEGNQYTKAAKGMILMAIAIRILAGAVEKLGKLSLKELAKGLGSVAAMLIMLTGATLLLGKMKDAPKGAGLILVLAVALRMLVKPIKTLSQIKASSLGKALIGVGTALGILVGSVILLSKMDKAPKGIAALITLAIVMNALVPPIQKLSQIKFTSMAKALIGVGASIGILVGAVFILSKLKDAPKGILALVTLAGVMNALVPPIQKLSKIKSTSLAKAILGIAGSLGILVGSVFILSKLDSGGKGVIALVTLAAVMNALVPPIQKLSKIKASSLGKALIGIAGSLGILVGAVAVLSTLDNGGKGALMLVVLAGVLTSLIGPIESLSKIKFTSLAKALGAVTVSLGLLVGSVIVLSKIKGGTLGSAVTLMILAGVINAIVPPIQKLSQIKFSSLVKSLGALAIGMGLMVVALAAVADTDGALTAAASFIVMAAAVSILSKALTRMSKIKFTDMATALIGLATVFALIIISVNALKGSELTLLAFSASLIAVGAGFTLVGAGMLLFGAGINLLGKGLHEIATALIEVGQNLATLLATIVSAIWTNLPTIFNVLSAALQGFLNMIITNAPLIGQTIMTLIETVLTVIGTEVPNIVTTVLQTLVAILDALIEYAPQIVAKVAELLITVLGKLTEYIPQLVAAVSNLIVAALGALAEHIPDIVTAAVDLIVAFVGAIANNLGKVVDAALDLIVKFIEALADGIDQHGTDLLNAAEHLVDSFVTFLGEAVGRAVGDLPGLAADFVKGFTDGIQEAVDNSEGLQAINNFASNALDWLKNALGIHSPSTETKAVADDYVAGFNNGLTEGDPSGPAGSFATKALNALQTAFNKTVNLGGTIVSGIGSGIQTGAKWVTQGVGTVVSTASKVVSGGATVFKSGGSKLVSAVSGGISAGAKWVSSAASTATSGGSKAVSSGASMFKKGGSALINSVKSGISGGINIVKDASKNVSVSGANGVLSSNGRFKSNGSILAKSAGTGIKSGSGSAKTAGVVVANAGASGVSSGSGRARNAGNSVGKAAANGLKSSSGSARSSGVNLISGFVGGINSMAGRVMSAASSIASRAAAKIKSALKIGSPSRITRSYGKFFSLGLAYGIEDKTSLVVSNAKAIADAASNTFSNSLNLNESRYLGTKYANNFVSGISSTESSMISAVNSVGKAITVAANNSISQDPYNITTDINSIATDTNPSVSPVIDFTNIQTGAQQIQDMLNGMNYTMNITPNLSNLNTPSDLNSSIAYDISKLNNNDVVSAINTLRTNIDNLGQQIAAMQIVLDTGAIAGGVTDKVSNNMASNYNSYAAVWW